MSMSARTFEEAVQDLLLDYEEVPKRERMKVLRAAAAELGTTLRGTHNDEPEDE